MLQYKNQAKVNIPALQALSPNSGLETPNMKTNSL